jgi:hypothetical protein
MSSSSLRHSQRHIQSVPPSLAAPRYRNSSVDIAGVVSKMFVAEHWPAEAVVLAVDQLINTKII